MFSSRHPAGCHSHLYISLRSYLDNQSRAQPIIGLNSITEVLSCSHPALYFCDVCFLRITKADIRNHIMGSMHKYNYIKSHHAHGWRSYTDLTLLARPLMNIAKMVEKKEGTGDIKVVHVNEVTYNAIKSLPVSEAFAEMKMIKDHQKPNALNSHNNSQFEGNETSVQGQQELGNTNGTGHPQHLGRSLPAQTAGPVKPLSTCQDVSTPPSAVDTSSLGLGQHINREQSVIRIQTQQSYTIPPENHCLTEARPISVIRLSRQWSPISISYQNHIVDAGGEHGDEDAQSFGVSYETHSQHSMPNTAYEAQVQTSYLSVSHMTTQDLTNRHEYFRNVSSPAFPEPVCGKEIGSFIKPISSHVLTRTLEPTASQDPNLSYDEADSQEPNDTGWEEHVEAESDNCAEENSFLSSPSLDTQNQNLSDQFQTVEDFIENYNGRKPLIGLQAVIKCQSVDGNPPPFFYLCQLCLLKLRKKKKMISHLTKPEHQRSYLKVLHPRLLPKKHKPCLTNEMLEDIAIKLEKEDGRGHMKVMRLSACLFSEILNKDYQSCMNVLNCGAGVEWRSDLLSFKEGTAKTTGPSQTLKRPAESLLPPSEKSPIRAPDEAPTQLMSKKLKKDPPNTVMCSNEVSNPVFKVSLSLQEGPVVIERAPLRDSTTVAPEIEDRRPASTCTDDNPLPLETNTQSEVHMCIHGCPHTVYHQYPEVDNLTQTDEVDYTHTEVNSHTDRRMFEGQFMSPGQSAYAGRFDQTHTVEASLRPEDSGFVEEVHAVTYADWPEQDWSFNNNQWQSRDVNDYSACPGYMQF